MTGTKPLRASAPALNDRARGGESPAGELPLMNPGRPAVPARGVSAEEQEMIAGPDLMEDGMPPGHEWSSPGRTPSDPRASFWRFGGSPAPRPARPRPAHGLEPWRLG